MTHLPRRATSLRALARHLVLPLTLTLPALAQESPPPIFQDLDFAAAQEAATSKNGLMILDAMTSWCGPCKQMDRTTWIDPRLVEWIEANAVAIQLDMDEHVTLKKELEIRAFPTILLFKGGVEFDRVVGLRSADEMLAWLGAGVEGKRAKDTVLERLAELRTSSDAGATWGERAKLVEDLKWFGETDEALREHLWLWNNVPAGDRALDARRQRYRWGSQRFSMHEVASQSPTALAAFRSLRDELTSGVVAGSTDSRHLRDWIELNFVIDDEAATVRWARAATGSAAGIAQLRTLEGRLFDLLVEHEAWRTAGLTLDDPVERTRQQRDSLGAYDEGSSGGSGGMMPAIPMGGMRPAKKADTTTESAAVEEASATPQGEDAGKQSMPAIPLGTKKQAGQTSMPMIPMGGGPAADPEEDTATVVRRLLTEQFRTQASQRYGALLAAERDGEAGEVAHILIAELDDTRARAALLATALRAGAMQRAPQVHQGWLDWMAR